MSARPQAVITGIGTVDAFGGGRQNTARALQLSEPCLSEIDRSAGYHSSSRSRSASLVHNVDFRAWLSPMAARRMSPPSKYAVTAAKMALAEAGLEPDTDRIAVVLGTSYGAASVTEKILRQIMFESPEAVSPALFTESVANAPAAQVALACAAHGANITVTQREASALLAVAAAAAEVRRDRARYALAGAVEELNPLIHSILDRFGTLARADRNGTEVARPFDRHRRGFIAGDGATVLVLEDEAAARARGANPLARIAWTASAFDPGSPAAGFSTDPTVLARSLRSHFERHRLDPAHIDLVVSGATGSVPGDRLEALVLRSVWGKQPLPPVTAPKAVTGDHGGGLLAAAVLVSDGLQLGPTRGFENQDPELGITPHDGRRLPPPQRILVTSLAAGGAAAWLVLERCTP